jgi:hypothetical protein
MTVHQEQYLQVIRGCSIRLDDVDVGAANLGCNLCFDGSLVADKAKYLVGGIGRDLSEELELSVSAFISQW